MELVSHSATMDLPHWLYTEASLITGEASTRDSDCGSKDTQTALVNCNVSLKFKYFNTYSESLFGSSDSYKVKKVRDS